MSENNRVIEKIEEFVYINDEIKIKIELLHVFRDYFNKFSLILVTNEDKVYCFGDNSFGVLGFGDEYYIWVLTNNVELSNKGIIDFKSNECSTVARDRNGKLYCWGTNEYLGNGREDDKISKPELNKYLINENIIDMCCGHWHTLVLTSNNEVYVWGHNDCGQIGNTSNDLVSKPFKLYEFNREKVKAISCGLFHSMALTESGCVYSWGKNSSGQLGFKSVNKNVNNPKYIKIDVKIKKISCGLQHSLLLSNEGDIYAFGRNQYKQLGLKTNKLKIKTPIKLNHSEKFIDIASHYLYNMSIALSENSFFYVWGECGEEGTVNEPKKTQFKSFDEIFAIMDNNILFHTGKYINYWIELQELGKGSFGTVFKVKHKLYKNMKDEFAIKKIEYYEGNSLNMDSFKEFVNSTIILTKNESEFLVNINDMWFEKDFQLINGIRKYNNNQMIYIWMELCDKTLSSVHTELKEDLKLFSNNSLTLLGYYVLSELFIEILKGVDFLHNNNMIHRDLHPKNILVKIRSNGNCIKIGDFGLAKVHDVNKINTGDIGSIIYSAPEVLDSEEYDTRADIYSLGVVLQELFDIDLNSDNINVGNQTSLLMSKYENLKDLSIEMTNEIYRKRPNCGQIMEERDKWALNESEFNFKEELDIIIKISSENRSYVQNLMVSKLLKVSELGLWEKFKQFYFSNGWIPIILIIIMICIMKFYQINQN